MNYKERLEQMNNYVGDLENEIDNIKKLSSLVEQVDIITEYNKEIANKLSGNSKENEALVEKVQKNQNSLIDYLDNFRNVYQEQSSDNEAKLDILKKELNNIEKEVSSIGDNIKQIQNKLNIQSVITVIGFVILSTLMFI